MCDVNKCKRMGYTFNFYTLYSLLECDLPSGK